MATNATPDESVILQQAIRLFHKEPAHSKARKDIIAQTVNELQNISGNVDYWNDKRVRTWFWNHRAEVQEEVGEKRPLPRGTSPPKKRKKLKSIPPDNLQTNQRTEALNDAQTSDSQETNSELDDSEDLDGEEIDELTDNSPLSTELIFSESFDENNPDPNSLLSSNLKTFRIFSCRAIGPDKNAGERWQNFSSGYIVLHLGGDTGRVSWKHDREYNSFVGELIAVQRNRSPVWSEYQLRGRIGSELMANKSVDEKQVFSCFLRRILTDDAERINVKLEQRRLADLDYLGESEFNDQQAMDKLKVQENDIEARFQFYSVNGKTCGVRVFARRTDPIEEVCQWRPNSVWELKLALHTVQDYIQVLKNKTENVRQNSKNPTLRSVP